MCKLLAAMLLAFVISGSTGCILAAGYAGAQVVGQRDDTKERMACEKAGDKWIKGNSWVFKDGECVRK